MQPSEHPSPTKRLRSTVRVALISIMALGFASVGGVPVLASELDDLKAQMEILMRKVEELEAKQAETAKEAKEAKEAAERMPLAAPQRVVTSGKDDVKLSVSGQVNRGVLFVDNGDKDDIFHVDNDNSSTRVRFIGAGKLDEDITVGTQIEVQFESNSTAAIRIDQDSAAGPITFTERKLELYADSKRLGRLWIGQGDTASNGSSEVDLSGTSVIAYSGIAAMAGGIAFSDNNVLGPRINQAFSNFDGLSRDDRIRYDTPSFSGFKGSVSAVEGGAVDAALRFSGEIAETKVVAAAAWADASSKDSNNFKQYNGSVSVLFPMGISLTGALGMRELDSGGDDPLFYYGKLGYSFDAVDFGATSVAVDYAAVDDLNQEGDEFTSYGVSLVQNFDKIGTEFYLGARNHELDRADSNFDDIFAILGGARVKF